MPCFRTITAINERNSMHCFSTRACDGGRNLPQAGYALVVMHITPKLVLVGISCGLRATSSAASPARGSAETPSVSRLPAGQRADPIDRDYAGDIRQLAEQGRSNRRPCQTPVRRTSPNHPYPPGHEFLRVDQNRGEGEGSAPGQSPRSGRRSDGVVHGERQRKRQHAEDGPPDHVLAANAVAHRSADDRPCRHRTQKHEQADLRCSHGNVETAHQEERVITGNAGEVNVFRNRGVHTASAAAVRRRVSCGSACRLMCRARPFR